MRAWLGFAQRQEMHVKKSKKRNAPRVSEADAMGKLEWTPLFQAFEEAFDWALDVAAKLARDFPEEVEAVERVRRFMRMRLAGYPAHVKLEDVLFTFGLLIGAIERDLGPTSNLGPWFGTPVPLQFPGIDEVWERIVPRHVTGLGRRSRPNHFPVA
jgi:hypothetical protein